MRLIEIIIAARPDEYGSISPLFSALAEAQPEDAVALRMVEGGAERQQSVGNAVRAAGGDFVMVHDAARPLVSAQLINRVCVAARRDGAAIPALQASDTVKAVVLQDNRLVVRETLERKTLWLVQTPQVFRREILATALTQAEVAGFTGTDCASLVEQLTDAQGQPLHPVTVVEGEANNFKVTYPPDLERAAALLKKATD